MSNPDRRDSRRARRICIETHARPDHLGRLVMMCSCGCKQPIYPTVSIWRADHSAHWANTKRDSPETLFPILTACDEGKDGKAAKDAKFIAHGKRVADKLNGYKRRGRPMLGSRDSPFKKRMDGTVVRR